jgi:pimeloyl-ACP methyl ester carboxylesterase
MHVDQQSERGPPLELVGHSIGAHLGLEALRRHPRKVLQVAGVYPYLTNNPESWEQAFLSKLVHMPKLVWLAGEERGAAREV